ncbi:HypC/HybG/HupF family hydrogenase formation chaperone [Candidatus Sumerlaeota bacterium]|nr:HypC/HybG/HupF family hydrogenase formation chaperone [Candidatus Sumerlaeota bacterium]
MCLGIPGQITEIAPNERHPNFAEGKANFGGVTKTVSLAYIPEARVGDYVIVHAGFAISRIDETEARRVFEYLREMDELGDLQ